MKNILLALMLVFLTAEGCPQPDYSANSVQVNARQAVVKEFKTSDVYEVPDSAKNYQFIARDADGNVWNVQVYVTTNITGRTLLFRGSGKLEETPAK